MNPTAIKEAVERIGLVERTNDPVGSLRKVYADAPDPVDAMQRDESLIAGALTDPRPLDRTVLVEEFGFEQDPSAKYRLTYTKFEDQQLWLRAQHVTLIRPLPGVWIIDIRNKSVSPEVLTVGDLHRLIERLGREGGK
jgi:hypothetical protein